MKCKSKFYTRSNGQLVYECKYIADRASRSMHSPDSDDDADYIDYLIDYEIMMHELTELFVILIILGIVAAIVLPSFLPKNTNNSNIENVEFVVDTLINDSEAVIKLNQIEIIVNNPYKWKETDTLILNKK